MLAFPAMPFNLIYHTLHYITFESRQHLSFPYQNLLSCVSPALCTRAFHARLICDTAVYASKRASTWRQVWKCTAQLCGNYWENIFKIGFDFRSKLIFKKCWTKLQFSLISIFISPAKVKYLFDKSYFISNVLVYYSHTGKHFTKYT